MVAFLPFAVPVAIAAGLYLIRKQREYSWGWARSDQKLDGKLFIVTGANTGLGYEVTRALVKRGAKVILACRNIEKANEAIKKIREETQSGEMIALQIDLADFDSIKKFAALIKEKYPKFDCLINNAGLVVQDDQKTKNDIELHTGTNYIGPFLLTNLLMDTIRKNKSRVVVVSSRMHEKGVIDFENFGKFVSTPKLSPRTNCANNNSKLMNFYFAKELYKRGVDVHVCCPGLSNTDFFRAYDPKFYHYILFSPVILFLLRSAEQGAQNIIYCATDDVTTEEMNPDKSFIVYDLKQHKSKVDLQEDVSEKLWAESAILCGL